MNYNSSRWNHEAQATTAVYQSSIQPIKNPRVPIQTTRHLAYAGFWERWLAYAIDTIFLGMLIVVPAMIDPSFRSWMLDNSLVFGSVCNLFVLLYFAGMESSASQATIGKMVMGLKVTDLDGGQISFVRALGRTGGKMLSSLFMNLGFIIAAFTGRKQALHDIVAGTLVVSEIR